MRPTLDITCGTDVVLNVRLIFRGETFDPSLSSEVEAYLVSGLGRRTAVDVDIIDDEAVVTIPWITGRLPGRYGLEVRGMINGLHWSTVADGLIRYTRGTMPGTTEPITVESDAYDISMEVSYRYGETPLEEVTATVDDGVGEPSVDYAYVSRKLRLDFHNLKGDEGVGFDHVEGTDVHTGDGETSTYIVKRTDGSDGGTIQVVNGRKGSQGDSAVFDPDDPDTPSFEMANTLGGSSQKAITQKAVTEAIVDNMATEWEDVEGEVLTALDMDSSGNVTAYSGQSPSYHKIFYAPVHEGKPIEVTFTKAASDLMRVVIALFNVEPAAGGSARQDGVLFAETVPAGTHTFRYPVNAGSYIALATYGASTSVTFKEGLTATDILNDVEERMDDLDEGINGASVDVSSIMSDLKTGHFVSYKGNYSGQSSYGTTPLFTVQKGDVLTVTSSDNSSPNPAIIAKYLSTEPFDYDVNHSGVFQCLLQGEGDGGGLKTRIYTMPESCTIMISYLLSGGLELSISRGGIVADIEGLQAQVEDINPIDHTDGATIGTDNPLAHIISGPSRVRTFKSYGVIGGSFETGYTNAEDGSSSATPYDVGYEWPTLMAKANGVVCYNYALPGHSWKSWLADRNKTTYTSGNEAPLWKNAELPWASHRMPWNNPEFTEKPECFVLNLSSNDASASYTIGDANDIDFENDYTDDEAYSDRSFVEAAAAILQLIRIKSPRCYIFVANMRAGRSESRVSTLNEAVDTIVQKFNEYAGHCYLLDITSHGFDWNTNGANKYVSGDASSHPTRLGHVYLADQFNTYIDWYIANHPEEFLDAAYVGPMQYQYTDPVTHERKWAEKYYTRQSS